MWYLGLANNAMTVSDAEKTLMVQNLYVWVDLITMISAEETKLIMPAKEFFLRDVQPS